MHFSSGESILNHSLTALNSVFSSRSRHDTVVKGNEFNITQLPCGHRWWWHEWSPRRDTELGQEFSFLVNKPERGARALVCAPLRPREIIVMRSWSRHGIKHEFCASPALCLALENRTERVTFAGSRTNYRNRSSRWKASGRMEEGV